MKTAGKKAFGGGKEQGATGEGVLQQINDDALGKTKKKKNRKITPLGC